MKNGKTVTTFRGINFFHDWIARLCQRFLGQFIAFFKNSFPIITEKEFPLSHESANLYIWVFLHLAINFLHGTDTKIIDPVLQHVETDGTRFWPASFYSIQKEGAAFGYAIV